MNPIIDYKASIVPTIKLNPNIIIKGNYFSERKGYATEDFNYKHTKTQFLHAEESISRFSVKSNKSKFEVEEIHETKIKSSMLKFRLTLHKTSRISSRFSDRNLGNDSIQHEKKMPKTAFLSSKTIKHNKSYDSDKEYNSKRGISYLFFKNAKSFKSAGPKKMFDKDNKLSVEDSLHEVLSQSGISSASQPNSVIYKDDHSIRMTIENESNFRKSL